MTGHTNFNALRAELTSAQRAAATAKIVTLREEMMLAEFREARHRTRVTLSSKSRT